MDVRDYILQEIRRVARSIEPEPLTKKAFMREGKVSENKVRYHFGSWNEAVKAAGLKPNPSGIPLTSIPKIEETDLLDAIGELLLLVVPAPTESLMNSGGRSSVQPYRKRWGSLGKAVQEYRLRHGEPLIDIDSVSNPDHPNTGAVSGKSRASIVLPPIHKPKSVTNRPRILYGEPIDFRGLRYAPVTEQGVVYLFGMVSRELGFLIESVRTDYPDCEGKRSLDQSGAKWQHVRIEFEYRSKNFAEHGHDPDECDVIVCWIHDWVDCPVEVLELKGAISLLPNR